MVARTEIQDRRTLIPGSAAALAGSQNERQDERDDRGESGE
jgi:hypothetical protein